MINRLATYYWILIVLVLPSALWASSLPEFCQNNFPVLDRSRIDRDNVPVTFTNSDGDERYCLHTHQAGLEVSVPASDILRFYSDVQEVEYQRAAETFRTAMREKVLRSLVQSMQPYEGLFQRQSCSDLRGSGHLLRNNIARCERAQNIVPQCRNPELAAIIQSEDQRYVENLESEARHIIETEYIEAGHPEGDLGDIPLEQLQNAERYLSDYKKQTFLSANIHASILAQALLVKKARLEETFNTQMRRNDTSLSVGFGEFGSETNELEQFNERRRVIEENHEREMEQVQLALSRLYERNPTVLNVKNSTRFLFFSNSDYELSPLAESLSEQFQAANPDFNLDQDHTELSEYLGSIDARNAIHLLAERQMIEPSEELENLGRDQVFAELSKKREAIEMLCNDDPQNLHHFQNLALELLQDTAQEHPDQLTAQQAGYCYLAQREPPTDGSLPLGMTIVAGVAIVGGVAAQFFPIVGNAVGGASIAYGIAALGGATLAVDSVSRYSTALTNDAHTQTVYQAQNLQGSFAWVTAEERMISEDTRRTQRNIAIAEVGLTAVDALVIARPALALLRSNIPTPTPRVAPAGSAIVSTTPPPGIVTRAPVAPEPSSFGEALPQLPSPLVQPQIAPATPDLPRLSPPAQPEALVRVDITPPLPPGRMTSAQREALERFQRLSIDERAQEIARIRARVQAGQVDDTEFLTLIMNVGEYTPSVFTSGPQNLAFDILNSLGDREAALDVIRRYYRNLDSERSIVRRSSLEQLINDIHPSPIVPSNLSVAPVAPVNTAAPIAETPLVIRSGEDPVISARTPSELGDGEIIEGTYTVLDDVTRETPRAGLSLDATPGPERAVAGGVDAVVVTAPLRLAIPLAEERFDDEPEEGEGLSPLPSADTLEIVVTIEAGEQTFDTDYGFRQQLTARAITRSGEPLPDGFHFSWSSQSLAESGESIPLLGGMTGVQIMVAATSAPYAVIASGRYEGATVIASVPYTVQQAPIPVNLTITKSLSETEVTLQVNAVLDSDLPEPNLSFEWEIPNSENQTGQTITLPRQESDYTVNVTGQISAEEGLRYNISGASDTILAIASADEEEPSPASDPDEVTETATWTVYIESAEVIPDTATMRVRLRALAEGGSSLPENLSLSLESFDVQDQEAPDMPAATSGAEAEFEIPLIDHAYGITAISSSGDQRVEGDDRLIEACLEVAVAACLSEDGELLDSELPLPPGQPPQRFSPLQVPTPQMFVIPGFF